MIPIVRAVGVDHQTQFLAADQRHRHGSGRAFVQHPAVPRLLAVEPYLEDDLTPLDHIVEADHRGETGVAPIQGIDDLTHGMDAEPLGVDLAVDLDRWTRHRRIPLDGVDAGAASGPVEVAEPWPGLVTARQRGPLRLGLAMAKELHPIDLGRLAAEID